MGRYPFYLPCMGATQGARRRRRGEIEELPSGALRVRVHAGIDPVTNKRHRLEEIVPAGPKAAAQAEKVRTRLLAEVDAGRQPRTSATVAQLMERYLEVIHVEPSTRQSYEGLARKHILPLLGELQAGRVRGDVLTRSTPSFDDVASTVDVSAGSSTTARRQSTPAMSGAAHIGANRWGRARSATLTIC
jgi:Phage integrase, N-terminal SAM-like domain